VEDRNSGNGTKVNGRRVESGGAAVALRSGDQLTLGEVELGFEILR
jgi:pSer/pThr/pTyr-binding forkhead associated (FHA) protein